MEQVVYSVRAEQDIELYRNGNNIGFGLVSGIGFGHVFAVDRLHFIGSRYGEVLDVFRNMKIRPDSDWLGLFSIGIADLPSLQYCGLFLMITDHLMVPYSCNFNNGKRDAIVQPCKGVVEWQ